MNKTYFCSDAHFDHPNILKYEPQRIEKTVCYICELGKEFEMIEKLDYLNKKYNNDLNYINQYNASVISNMIETDDFIARVAYEVFDDNNFFDEEMSKDEIDTFKNLQQEQKQVILDYHNEMLVTRWNEVVDVNDSVYFLGDFAFKNKTKAEIIGRQLNGHKTIILGNHDDRKHNEDGSIKYNSILEAHFKACGFENVEFNPIILKGHFILSHEPLQGTGDCVAYFNIYGHVHSSKEYETKTKNSFCCCLDRHDYYPVQLEEYDKYNVNK